MTARLAAYGIAGAVLAILATVAWVTVTGWRRDALALPGVEMRLAATIAAEETARAFRAARSREVAADESALAAAAARLPARPVRLCINPAPAGASAGTGSEGARTAAAAGLVPATVGGDPLQGPDVGPDVRALMLEAERVAAVARAAQAYAIEVGKLNANE